MSSQSPITKDLKNQFVRAGAGAGKTYSLTRSVLAKAKLFKEKNMRWPQFVVSTFTVKATQELRERLVLLAKEEEPELLDFVSSSSFLKVSTLHGIFSGFLRSKAALFGLDPSFKVISEAESEKYLRSIIRESIFSEENNSLLSEFNFSEIVQLFKSFYSAYSEDNSIKPIDLALLENLYESKLSFYKDCFLEMGMACQAQPSEKWKLFGKGLVELFSRDVRNMTSSELIVAFSGLGKKPMKTKNIEADLSDSLKDVISGFKKEFSSKICDLDFWIEKQGILLQMQSYFEGLYEVWAQYKKSHGIMDIEDLELQAYRLLQSEPEIAAEYAEQFDYWFVDEFQDTSPLQLKILDIIVGSSPSYVVGDPQQSIYLFRGARSEVFTDKENAFGDVTYMQNNYRSQKYLLDFVNHVFGQRKFLSMEPIRETTKNNEISFYSVEKESEAVAVYNQVDRWVKSGQNLSDIAVLARKKSDLILVASVLSEYGISYNHLSVGRYSRKREVLDAEATLRFLLNPHDNKNLILLLRSPYFWLSDNEIYQAIKKFEKESSYWSQWSLMEDTESPKVITVLKSYLERVKKESLYVLLEEIFKVEGFFDAAYSADNSGVVEANLWKFLNRVRTEQRAPGFNPLKLYGGIESLTENLLASDVEAPAPLESSGVNLLTIHASKGLQYKNVIVMGCGQSPQVTKSSAKKDLLRVMDGRWSCSFKAEDGSAVYSLMDELKWKEFSKRELSEHERLFYVAVTRAEDNLCLVGGSSKKSSWMETFKLESIDSTEGFAFKNSQISESDSAPLGQEALQSKEVKVRSPYSSTVTANKFSVSEILSDLNNEKENELEIIEKIDLVKSSVLGQKIHKYFENKKYNPDYVDKKYEEYWVNIADNKKIPFLDIISAGYVEWGFQVKIANGTLEGQIDLWAELDGEVWLIDYKTGSSRYKESSFKQLDIYSWALSLHKENKPIKQCLIYPVSNEIYIKDFGLEAFKSSRAYAALEK